MKTFFILFFLPVLAQAANLSAPFLYDSTNVLPKGVRNVRLQGFTTEAANAYDETANTVPLGNGFNQPVTYGKVLKSLSPADQAKYGGYLKSVVENFSESGSIGDAEGVVAARVTATVPAFAYGINEKWTAGIAVPIIYSNLAVTTGYTANEQMKAIVNDLAMNGNTMSAAEVAQKMSNLVQYQATQKGYLPVEDQEKTQIGDVMLVSKYVLHKDEKHAVALTNSLALPTGRRSDINKVVDIGSGDGDFKVSAGVVADWNVHRKVTLTGSANYLAQLPDELAKRIPEERGEALTSDIDPTTYRDLGDIVRTGLTAKYQFHSDWAVQSSYNYQFKQSDLYRGAQYTPERYAWLEDNTQQTMQTAQVGVAFSTVSMYRRQKFAVPLDAGLNYTTVLDGRNVTRDSLTSFEMAMYF